MAWPGKIKYYALSSGTSESASKYIPVTRELLRSNTINYLGSVTAHSGDIDMSSESLEVILAGEGGSVEHAMAQGKVEIMQGARKCKGDKADYFLNPRKFVMVGNPAEVNDPEKGRSFARRLTSFIADDRILLEDR